MAYALDRRLVYDRSLFQYAVVLSRCSHICLETEIGGRVRRLLVMASRRCRRHAQSIHQSSLVERRNELVMTAGDLTVADSSDAQVLFMSTLR